MKKIRWIILLAVMFFIVGCGKSETESSKEYLIYAVDKDETKVVGFETVAEASDTREILQIMFRELKKTPEKNGYKSAVSEGVCIKSFSLNENHLTLNFSAGYREMNSIQEVLSRAAIVRTLCQIEGIDYVSFKVEGEPYVNSNGYAVGLMSGDQFVDNAGDEINAYEKADLILYFANEEGNYLCPHTVECVYNSNISLDKLVMEQLISGPQEEENEEKGYAAINPATQILSVTTQDGLCYVNLSEDFLVRQGNVTPEVAVYSVVNSLIELQGVNRVQISVGGNSEINYMEKISLAQPFERNLEIIDNAQ